MGVTESNRTVTSFSESNKGLYHFEVSTVKTSYFLSGPRTPSGQSICCFGDSFPDQTSLRRVPGRRMYDGNRVSSQITPDISTPTLHLFFYYLFHWFPRVILHQSLRHTPCVLPRTCERLPRRRKGRNVSGKLHSPLVIVHVHVKWRVYLP